MKNTIIVLVILSILFVLFISFNKEHSTSSQFDKNSTITSEAEEVDDPQSNLKFNGYECTDDCSGHEAGYNWAEEKGITQDDVDNYSGNSNSFMEGMQSYVDENY